MIDRGPQTDTASGSARLENGYSVVGWPICPGLYAGRVADRVKIGQSMNLPQRVDAFKFDELLGLRPLVVPPAAASDHPEDHVLEVKRHLVDAERQILAHLAPYRIHRQRRANAHEWFAFDDAILRALFDEGWIVARARVSGPPLGTRFGRAFWPVTVR
jgi:hypothetical protein